MNLKNITKNLTRLLPVFGLSLLLLIACSPTSPDSETNSDSEIYSTVIRQIVETDDTFGGTLEKPVIYVIGKTDDSAGDPTLAQSEPEVIPGDVREDINAALSDLPSTITWVEDRAEVELDENGGVADGGVIVTLGNIHRQDDGTVQVGGSIYIGNLAAGGQTYVLEQQDGAWVITGTVGFPWVS